MTDEVPTPTVEWITRELACWTFDTEDSDEQQRQFNHWCGWFGFDEDEQPELIHGATWIFRHRRPDLATVAVNDAAAQLFLDELKARRSRTPSEQAMIDYLERAWRDAAKRSGPR